MVLLEVRHFGADALASPAGCCMSPDRMSPLDSAADSAPMHPMTSNVRGSSHTSHALQLTS